MYEEALRQDRIKPLAKKYSTMERLCTYVTYFTFSELVDVTYLITFSN